MTHNPVNERQTNSPGFKKRDARILNGSKNIIRRECKECGHHKAWNLIDGVKCSRCGK